MRHQFIILAALLILLTHQKTKEEWKSRTMYQFLTDRFARGDGANEVCKDIHDYCGGDFKGILNNLDYIQGMGFDAIWISPIVSNHEKGYHGYAAKNLYEVNPKFGTAQDLKALINECHRRDIWVMLDVVANHMGNLDTDFSVNFPFNDASHYHDYCIISDSDFSTHNIGSIQYCRLSGLADLNQDNPYVEQELYRYVKYLISEYGFDGMRLDTVMQIRTDFWEKFTAAAGVYSIGEVFDGDARFLSEFIGPLDALLNYPLFYTLRNIFLHWGDMDQLEDYYQRWESVIGKENIQYLGNFNDNHDNIRFLNELVRPDMSIDQAQEYQKIHGISDNPPTLLKIEQFKAITAFCLTSIGIPVIYYGSEQNFHGAVDPLNREILWNNLDTTSELYQYIKTINAAKTQTNATQYEQIQRYSDADLYAFTRGELFAAFSSKYDRQIVKDITYHPYKEGQVLCNIFWKTDCVTIVHSQFKIYLNYGEVKILIPV